MSVCVCCRWARGGDTGNGFDKRSAVPSFRLPWFRWSGRPLFTAPLFRGLSRSYIRAHVLDPILHHVSPLSPFFITHSAPISTAVLRSRCALARFWGATRYGKTGGFRCFRPAEKKKIIINREEKKNRIMKKQHDRCTRTQNHRFRYTYIPHIIL